MRGTCACRTVTITVARAPEYINFCNCGLCRKTGGGWGYFDRDDVTVDGALKGFKRPDIDEVCLETQFCPGCGSAVRWIAAGSYESRRVGVNMKLFDPADLKGIETRFPDGIAWAGERPCQRHAPLPYGEGMVF
ncbi:GFA family protein [Parablastomonas sp. CN1-191]|uniref:GFA family protein n=1 Tax=Parablastomonas sp. CN1-191 TaxID=3400908 RepID=UPI003BF77BAD